MLGWIYRELEAPKIASYRIALFLELTTEESQAKETLSSFSKHFKLLHKGGKGGGGETRPHSYLQCECMVGLQKKKVRIPENRAFYLFTYLFFGHLPNL